MDLQYSIPDLVHAIICTDKTQEAEEADEESGQGASKLYVVCVAFPRLLRISGPSSGTNGPNSASAPMDFESTVCFAFLTRFPLFDLFFQLIFDLVSCERLQRMESIARSADADPDFKLSKQVYEYVPHALLDGAFQRLSALSVPRFHQHLRCNLYPGTCHHK
jgi:hypothetical protein